MFKTKRWFLVLLALVTLLVACAPPPPHKQLNVCSIFRQYPQWYWAAEKARKHWGVPVNVQMAILHQESRFYAHAKPPRRKLLGFIPWLRPTSSSGYTQAVNSTWRQYLHATGQSSASRASFSKATDFIGWFGYRAHKKLGIARNNTYELYLAYHEGLGGYSRRVYLHKPKVLRVAKKVRRVAYLYQTQLNRCERSLPRRHWWRIW